VDSINQLHFVEVDEQSEWNVQELHVAQKLRLMDGQDFLHRFEFDEPAAFDEHVESERFIEDQTFVFHTHQPLINRW
jgi:hypothetical protein